METAETTRLRWLLMAVLAVLVIGGTVDLILDAPERWFSPHVLLELAMVAFSLTVMLFLAHRWWRAERWLTESRDVAARRAAERDHWRRSASAAIAGFAAAVDRQFDEWQLTPAEREVAFLLLRGCSHKRIAAQTSRSERTTRQHAIAIYQKSGLGGRAELAAYFLEGLMPPSSRTAVPTQPRG